MRIHHALSVLVVDLVLDHLGGGVDDLLGRSLNGLGGGGEAAAGHGAEGAAGGAGAGDAGGHGDLDVLRGARGDLGVDAGDVDALGLVLVGGGDDLDDLVAGELEVGNVHGGAVHEVGVEDAQDGLVGDDEEVVLLALELEDDGLEADGEVVVGLGDFWSAGGIAGTMSKGEKGGCSPQHGGNGDDRGPARASRLLQGRWP